MKKEPEDIPMVIEANKQEQAPEITEEIMVEPDNEVVLLKIQIKMRFQLYLTMQMKMMMEKMVINLPQLQRIPLRYRVVEDKLKQ